MRLVDLEPRWFAAEGRQGQGMIFLCPHCRAMRLAVAFGNPLDGGPPVDLAPAVLWPLLWPPPTDPGAPTVPPGVHWAREGETFATLSLSPSVDASPAGHWHGFVRDGGVT